MSHAFDAVLAVPHPYTVESTPDGHEFTWPHPDACPGGETCEFVRRIRRTVEMSELADGLSDGTYYLHMKGFHGLYLVDADGRDVHPDTADQPLEAR